MWRGPLGNFLTIAPSVYHTSTAVQAAILVDNLQKVDMRLQGGRSCVGVRLAKAEAKVCAESRLDCLRCLHLKSYIVFGFELCGLFESHSWTASYIQSMKSRLPVWRERSCALAADRAGPAVPELHAAADGWSGPAGDQGHNLHGAQARRHSDGAPAALSGRSGRGAIVYHQQLDKRA